MSPSRGDAAIYGVGILLASASGCLQILIHDLLATALLVLASAMFLGGLRPRRPWRWALLITVMVFLVEFTARFLLAQESPRAELYESILVFIPGIVGSYGGSVFRQAMRNVWNK